MSTQVITLEEVRAAALHFADGGSVPALVLAKILGFLPYNRILPADHLMGDSGLKQCIGEALSGVDMGKRVA